MKLVDNHKIILTKAWSIRLTLFAAFCSTMELVIQNASPFLAAYIPGGILAVMGLVASLTAAVARVVQQQNISGRDEEE